MNTGRQGKVLPENKITFVIMLVRIVFLFPVDPVRHTGNIHHVGFGGDGGGELLADGTPVVDILV